MTQHKVVPCTENTWKFWCPGCDGAHVVSDSWQVDVSVGTITPSVLVHGHKKFVDSSLAGDALRADSNIFETPTCHSFVTGGRIQYLGDCTHALAGQTVDLPDWDRVLESWEDA